MKKPLILVADDDDDVREAVCNLLSGAGYGVLAAQDGAQALRLLREHREVHAILLDVAMPVMNGATFRGEQLADATIASVPLILMSGRDDLTPIGNVLGASACLRKPLSGASLLRTLDSLR
jgi:two-component system, chemotaxis family, chemotaxis protein CheY